MEGDAEQLRATRVEGTDDNEALTRFRLEHADDTPAQINAAMEAFIRENPASRLSPHFQSLLTQRKNGLSRLSAGQRVPNITLPPDGLGASTDTVFIKGGQVYTSPLHQVLPGVTRGKILEILHGRGVTVHETAISASEIASFEAAFISGTSPKVLPIASIGDVRFDVDEPLLRNIMGWYDAAFTNSQ